jgi:hypothetical protein
MAISFANTKGAAQKNDSYKYLDGEQSIRIFGDVIPRYVYWVKGSNNKDVPLECLSFDRQKEKFTNTEVDHVQKYFPDIMCIDPKDGKAKPLNLKKKLFSQIIEASGDLGDPTDLDNGWMVNFKRVKTGPLAYNVEYNLNVLRCKKVAATEEEREAIAEAKPIEELVPRPTAAEILELINKIKSGVSEDDEPKHDASTAEAIADI